MTIVGLAMASSGAAGQEQAQVINRSVLALYDSREEGVAYETRIHRYAEMPLNHLGFKVTLVDVNDGLPDVTATSGYRAVLTWFRQTVADPAAYGDWLATQIDAGRKLIVFGHLGLGAAPSVQEVRRRILAGLGLKPTGNWNDVTFNSRLHKSDPKFFKFEAALAGALPQHPEIELIEGQTTPLLQLSRRAYDGSDVITTLATVNQNGGYIAEGFAMRAYRGANRVRWLVNPFTYFSSALAAGSFPVPDVTTIMGRRLYFSHIDGDGWNNVSQIERYRAEQALSSEVVYRELINPYPDLPVTVGLIAGDVDQRMGGRRKSAAVARLLFALPQVEVGSHTHSHPFNWGYFARYKRSAELNLIDKVQQRSKARAALMLEKIGVARLVSSEQTDRRRFTSGSDDLPRTYMQQPFNLTTEIVGSLRTAESLAPPGKKAMLMQWSGNTSPYEAAIAMTRRAGVRNINGGDSRFDAAFPSVAYVPPIGRMVGRQRQIYAVNSNENTYTHDWTRNYFGLALVEETLRNTQAPRRLKGFNLYYHMYSGERPAALKAVRQLLERARNSAIIPIPASHYAAVADSFFDVSIVKAEEDVWRIEKRGALNTVRFDNLAKSAIDLGRSKGVVGFRKVNNATYVALDGAVDPAVVALSANTTVSQPYLLESRWRITKLKRSACDIRFKAVGFGSSQMTWQVPAQKTYQVRVSNGSRELWSATQVSSPEGKLVINASVDARKPLAVAIACQ